MSFPVCLPAASSPLDEDRAELLTISSLMESTVPRLGDECGHWRDRLEERLERAASLLETEAILEEAARGLRHLWLRAAAGATSRAYRSPTHDQCAVTPGGWFNSFGYERDLQPENLERRCTAFFPRPPAGWQADHVLFSSGQAAMLAVLTLLAARPDRTPTLRHDGSYFETSDLLSLFTKRFERVAAPRADIVIVEPLWCDGVRFAEVSLDGIASQARDGCTSCIVVDSTLMGLDDALDAFLCGLRAGTEVFRLHSGLKLFQGGLELADVGIVSVYGSDAGAELRRIRTLHGSGLRFADVAALEVPLFLDPEITRRYEGAVFAHNAMFAAAARRNSAFEVIYPDGGRAPFVVLKLRGRSSYEILEEKIIVEASRRGLVFQKGGSFGFRSHRFEAVRPEGGPEFLRVAMGRRGGPSLEGVLDLFTTLAPS